MDWWEQYLSLAQPPLAHCTACDVAWLGRPDSTCWLCGSTGPHEPLFGTGGSMLGDAYTPLTQAPAA